MSLEFTLVRRAISLAVIDGPDAGDNPDILKAQGSVLFEPVIKKGDSIQVQTRGGSETYALAPIECPINDGIISHRGQDGVKLPAGGEAANPSLIRWKATFSRMQAGGKSFTLAPVIFDAVPGGEIDLTMVAPVAGAPEGVVRGPRGTSLESIIVDGSELVFTAVDDAGSFEIARIPLDEMVRAEADAAADGVRDALAVDVAASQSARDAAEGHADRAATSESNAKTSETNAKQSETNAGDYAAVATTAATEAVDAMERATDLAGGDFATHEYVDDGLGGKADISYVDDAKWSRPRFGGNLNDLTTPGAYPITSSAINRPSSTEGTLEVTPVGGGTGVYQQFKEGGSEGITYVRIIRSAGSLPSDWTLLADQAYRLRQIRIADLDDMVESGIYAQHLTGNTSDERHYPVRRRGLLIVSAMGSGIISQTYLTPVGGFCRERQGDGTWLEWGSLAGSLDTDLISRIADESAEEAVRDTVKQIIEKSSPEKSLVTYGRSQPDPWIYPDTDLYWNGPNGTQFFPAGHSGGGLVGAVAKGTKYSSLMVEKADSDNIYISAVNPETGRHVTYRIEGKSGDDMAIISGIWVGDTTSEGRASRDTVLTQRSNMEWAFRLSIDGVEQFIPWHGDNTAIAVEPTVFTDSTGNIIDIEAQPHRVPIANLDGFKVKQKLWGRHPATGDKNHLLIEQVTSFSPDGLVRSETSVEFLETVSPIRQSAGNLPINAGVSDTFHVFGGGSYPVPAGTGSYQDIQITDDNFTSGMFTGDGGIFAAVNLIEPDYTLARSVPGLTGGGEKYIQVRPDGFVKFYQRSIAADQTVPRGTKWRFGAEWRYGEVDNPVQYV